MNFINCHNFLVQPATKVTTLVALGYSKSFINILFFNHSNKRFFCDFHGTIMMNNNDDNEWIKLIMMNPIFYFLLCSSTIVHLLRKKIDYFDKRYCKNTFRMDIVWSLTSINNQSIFPITFIDMDFSSFCDCNMMINVNDILDCI